MSAAPRLTGLTIVLPCRDEAAGLTAAVARARAAAARTSERFEVVIVDDGSGDGTGEIAARLAATHPSVRLVVHPESRGYGAALRSGIRAARMPWVLLTDAGLQLDPLQLEEFLPLVGSADLLVGYRVVRMDPLMRRVDAGLRRVLARALFGLRVRDVDCAFKLVPRDLAAGLELDSDGAAISTELLVKALRAGATLREVPVRHQPRAPGSHSDPESNEMPALRELAELRHRLAHVGPGAAGLHG
jgi:glycosyltransferase involved in cell wall biosynthesis